MHEQNDAIRNLEFKKQEFRYVGFWRRLAAFLIDFAILSLILVGIGSSLGINLVNPAKTAGSVVQLSGLFFSLVYVLLFWVNYDGATPGKRFVGIKVIQENGKQLGYPTAIIRYIGYWISSFLFWVGFLWVLWDKKKQAWHDKLAKTVVIKTDKQASPFLIFFAVLVSLLTISGIYTAPQVKKFLHYKGKQEKYVDTMKQYYEEVKKLDQEAMDLIKSARSKIEEANKKAKKTNLTSAEKEEIQALIADAIKDAKKASELDPKSSVMWLQLGNIYATLIGVAENADTWAIDSYKKAIEKNPENYLYYEKLGGVYLRIGKYEESIDSFRKVLELSPSYANGFYNLGVAYKKYGVKTRARQALEKALELFPDDDPERLKAERELETL